jgi:hypothetical protein
MREAERQATGIPELIRHLQAADRERRALQPSTPGYDSAAAKVERISRRIFEEAAAEEERAQRKARYGRGAGGSPKPQE